ncbi:MAG TPA: adenosylmethionine decarboxylase [Bacteroidetes bacterium]|nr:adenosylmethionine decarboxylase [Bacteroidota bacterium]
MVENKYIFHNTPAADRGLEQNHSDSNALGHQLMVEYYGCSPELLNDKAHIRGAMLEAASATGATVVGEVFHGFSPHGISGVVVIAESHLAIHTWPEYGYAALDLFTCGDVVDPYKGFDLLRRELGAVRFEVREFFRGRLKPLSGRIRHKPSIVEE